MDQEVQDPPALLQISLGSVVKQCWASPVLGWVTIQGKAGALGVMVVVALGFQVCHYHHAVESRPGLGVRIAFILARVC